MSEHLDLSFRTVRDKMEEKGLDGQLYFKNTKHIIPQYYSNVMSHALESIKKLGKKNQEEIFSLDLSEHLLVRDSEGINPLEEILKLLPNLKELDITRCRLEADDNYQVYNLLGPNRETSDILTALAHVPRLEVLTFAGVVNIRTLKMPNVAYLTAETAGIIRGLKELRKLDLSGRVILYNRTQGQKTPSEVITENPALEEVNFTTFRNMPSEALELTPLLELQQQLQEQLQQGVPQQELLPIQTQIQELQQQQQQQQPPQQIWPFGVAGNISEESPITRLQCESLRYFGYPSRQIAPMKSLRTLHLMPSYSKGNGVGDPDDTQFPIESFPSLLFLRGMSQKTPVRGQENTNIADVLLERLINYSKTCGVKEGLKHACAIVIIFAYPDFTERFRKLAEAGKIPKEIAEYIENTFSKEDMMSLRETLSCSAQGKEFLKRHGGPDEDPDNDKTKNTSNLLPPPPNTTQQTKAAAEKNQRKGKEKVEPSYVSEACESALPLEEIIKCLCHPNRMRDNESFPLGLRAFSWVFSLQNLELREQVVKYFKGALGEQPTEHETKDDKRERKGQYPTNDNNKPDGTRRQPASRLGEKLTTNLTMEQDLSNRLTRVGNNNTELPRRTK